MTPAEYAQGLAEDYRILDVSLQPTIAGAPHVELTTVTGPLEGSVRMKSFCLFVTGESGPICFRDV